LRRLLALVLVLVVATGLFYVSRFWPFELWTRQSWLGQMGWRPRGGMLMQWLRGTPFVQFELLLWGVGSFLLLSLTERLAQAIRGRDH
jgi:hypothetical protein